MIKIHMKPKTMLSVNFKWQLIILLQFILMVASISSCTKRQDSAYKAACHGDPLTTATRNEAIENAWLVNEVYDCVDKASYEKWAAALSPEELVAETSLSKDVKEKNKADSIDKVTDKEQYIAEALANMNIHPVEANTAYYFELGNIVGVGNEAGMQIQQAREKRQFTDWDDLLTRVPVFKVAKTAHNASISGMTVNGKSMPGADPDPKAAAAIYVRELRKLMR